MKLELALSFTCLVALFSRNLFSLCVRTRAGRLRSASGSRLSPLGCAADCLLLFALPLRRSFQIRCQLQHVSCGHCILGWGHQDPIRAFYVHSIKEAGGVLSRLVILGLLMLSTLFHKSSSGIINVTRVLNTVELVDSWGCNRLNWIWQLQNNLNF